MMLAAGVLTALAFTALPSVASAGEFLADCSSGATCSANVSGLNPELEDDSASNAGRVGCTSVGGTAVQTHNSSTGSVELIFHGCKEKAFGSNCQSVGQPAGTIKTNQLVSHLVYLEHDKSVKGVLLTGVNVTFTCFGGLVQKTVTGNIIGQIENPECGKFKASHSIVFEKTAGVQKWQKVTTTGTAFDLTSGSHSSDGTTSGQSGTGTLTYTEGKTVNLTC